MTVLEELEKIDDDCDKHGIQFVKIDDEKAAHSYGIESVPAIVYFEKQEANVYSGDLLNEEEILHWLLSQIEKDEIEDVSEEMLDKMVKEGRTLAVLFCKWTNPHAFVARPTHVHPSPHSSFAPQTTTTTRSRNAFSKNWRISTTRAMRWASRS